MKPWEETWQLDPDSLRRVRYVYAGEHAIEISPTGDADRAYEIQKLVAQAPAMARLLKYWVDIEKRSTPTTLRAATALRTEREILWARVHETLRDAGVIE